MSYAGQIMEDYFRRTGKPGAMGLDATYQYQVTVLRDLLERLEAVLEDEGVPPETITRVIRHMLYGSPSVADAEMRMQQTERIKNLLQGAAVGFPASTGKGRLGSERSAP